MVFFKCTSQNMDCESLNKESIDPNQTFVCFSFSTSCKMSLCVWNEGCTRRHFVYLPFKLKRAKLRSEGKNPRGYFCLSFFFWKTNHAVGFWYIFTINWWLIQSWVTLMFKINCFYNFLLSRNEQDTGHKLFMWQVSLDGKLFLV